MKYTLPTLTAIIIIAITTSCSKKGDYVKTLCGADSTYNYKNNDSFPATVFMASAFTPNGDKLNDCYRPAGNKISEDGYSFKILKGSDVVFETTNKYIFWNGTNKSQDLAGAGTYQYKVIAKLDGVVKTFDGDVTLLLRSKGNCIGTSDFAKLTFQDMIDPVKGFIYPTTEVSCK